MTSSASQYRHRQVTWRALMALQRRSALRDRVCRHWTCRARRDLDTVHARKERILRYCLIGVSLLFDERRQLLLLFWVVCVSSCALWCLAVDGDLVSRGCRRVCMCSGRERSCNRFITCASARQTTQEVAFTARFKVIFPNPFVFHVVLQRQNEQK